MKGGSVRRYKGDTVFFDMEEKSIIFVGLNGLVN